MKDQNTHKPGTYWTVRNKAPRKTSHAGRQALLLFIWVLQGSSLNPGPCLRPSEQLKNQGRCKELGLIRSENPSHRQLFLIQFLPFNMFKRMLESWHVNIGVISKADAEDNPCPNNLLEQTSSFPGKLYTSLDSNFFEKWSLGLNSMWTVIHYSQIKLILNTPHNQASYLFCKILYHETCKWS